MAIIKNNFPILEYDDSTKAIIEPDRKNNNFPKNCMMTFFKDVLEKYMEKTKAVKIGEYKSEMKDFPVWKVKYRDLEICLIQAVVGSGSIAMMTDFLIGGGVENLIVCGACGVLTDIPSGDIILPICALRDEGASYHYLPPKREVLLNEISIKAIKTTLEKNNVNYYECKTWTTDGFFRETIDMVNYRREEGCSVVEMECATIAAISEFRNIAFGQLLYAGDIIIGNNEYDERNWYNNLTAREKLFYLSLESLYELNEIT
jgi:uridine phosphorylase